MDLGNELVKAISSHEIFRIPFPGHPVPVTDTVVVTWMVMAFMIVSAFILTRKMKLVPEGKQNFIEVVIDFTNSISKNALGHHWKMIAPYLGTVFLFLLISNSVSIFNIIPSGEDLYKITQIKFFEELPQFSIRPPTRDVNVTACMAIMSIILVLISGIRVRKVSGWLKSFAEPVPILIPFKILDYFIRPLSLCFRLFGNILGALIIMELIYAVMPEFVPGVLSIYFDIFDSILQAYVFVFLTSLYIAEAIE